MTPSLAEGKAPVDALDGAAGHASQRVNLAAAGKAPIQRILTFTAERGRRRLRLLRSVAPGGLLVASGS